MLLINGYINLTFFTIDVVQEAMEGATSAFQGLSNFSVPLPVVMKIGKNWGDLKIVKNVSLGIASQQT